MSKTQYIALEHVCECEHVGSVAEAMHRPCMHFMCALPLRSDAAAENDHMYAHIVQTLPVANRYYRLLNVELEMFVFVLKATILVLIIAFSTPLPVFWHRGNLTWVPVQPQTVDGFPLVRWLQCCCLLVREAWMLN